MDLRVHVEDTGFLSALVSRARAAEANHETGSAEANTALVRESVAAFNAGDTTGAVFATGTTPAQLTVTAASGAPLTSFAAPLELTFPGAPAGFVPAYSTDGGATWTALPLLSGTTLPPGFRDGWFRDAGGTVHVLTLHATYFGVVSQASARSQSAVTFSYTHPLRLARSHTVNVFVAPTLPGMATAVLRCAGTRSPRRRSPHPRGRPRSCGCACARPARTG